MHFLTSGTCSRADFGLSTWLGIRRVSCLMTSGTGPQPYYQNFWPLNTCTISAALRGSVGWYVYGSVTRIHTARWSLCTLYGEGSHNAKVTMKRQTMVVPSPQPSFCSPTYTNAICTSTEADERGVREGSRHVTWKEGGGCEME